MHDEIALACRLEDKKSQLAEGTCALFADRLRQAYPDADVQIVAEDRVADLTLWVLAASDRRFGAWLEWQAGAKGEPLMVARQDAPLDDQARADLLDELIAQTPRPDRGAIR